MLHRLMDLILHRSFSRHLLLGPALVHMHLDHAPHGAWRAAKKGLGELDGPWCAGVQSKVALRVFHPFGLFS